MFATYCFNEAAAAAAENERADHRLPPDASRLQ